jgi:hypothetical protein
MLQKIKIQRLIRKEDASFPKNLQLAILSAPLTVIWPMSACNVSSQHFFKPCVQMMLSVKAQSTFFFIGINNAFWFVHYC